MKDISRQGRQNIIIEEIDEMLDEAKDRQREGKQGLVESERSIDGEQHGNHGHHQTDNRVRRNPKNG